MPLFVALDTALTQLGRWCDLGVIKTMNGTVPHPTALPLPPTFPAFLGLEDSTALQVQAPNMTVMDLFHANAGHQSLRCAAVANEQSSASSTGRMIPLGYLLSSLLLQSPGAASQQEANLFHDFLSQSQGNEAPLLDADQLHDFSIVEPTVVLGVTGLFWRKRYGLDATVHPFLPRAVAAYMTTAAGPRDVVVIQDDIDYVVVQRECHVARATQLPLPGASNGTKVSITHDVNGLAARRLVRDKYANGKWSTLGYLASRFAPGGSLGADNKLFAFAQPYASLSGSQLSGTTRFEYGVSVSEFRDLRANARCILESQALRVKSQATDFGLDKPERVVLVDDTDNCAISHLLAQVFAADVYAPEVRQDAVSFGAALLIHNHTHPTHMPRRKTQPQATPPLTPPTSGANTPPRVEADPARKCPPSPTPSDPGTVRTHLIAPKPQDTWEHQLYNAMMPEFHRLSNLIRMGVVEPSSLF